MHNIPRPEMIMECVRNREASVSACGALATWTYDGINYSFYTPTPTDYEEITDVLLPILYVDFPFVDCCG